MDTVNYFLVIILGLTAGSFVGALTYRLPRGKSIRSGRSMCPNCKEKISWRDNVPIFSYLSLKGKCRNCDQKISTRYPIIELSVAVSFLLMFKFISMCSTGLSFGILCQNNSLMGQFTLPYLFALVTLLISIFVIDIEHQIIPDELVFLGISLVFFSYIIFGFNDLFRHISAGFLSSLFLLALHLITRGKGMGLGDVKFAVFGGMVVGQQLVVVWMFLSFLIGSFIGILLILLGKAKFGRHIAFGPFLILSLFITMIWGNVISDLIFVGLNF